MHLWHGANNVEFTLGHQPETGTKHGKPLVLHRNTRRATLLNTHEKGPMSRAFQSLDTVSRGLVFGC